MSQTIILRTTSKDKAQVLQVFISESDDPTGVVESVMKDAERHPDITALRGRVRELPKDKLES
eukprot:8458761-Pyramimonas_sp.AAC.1